MKKILTQTWIIVLLALMGGGALPAQAISYSCDDLGIEAAVVSGEGPHTFLCDAPTEIILPSTQAISVSVILDGENRVTLSGAGLRQLFTVPSGVTLELRNMILIQGSGGNGGAIRVDGGTLILDNVVITDSETGGNGGAIFNVGGQVILRNGSRLINNSALGNGGAIYSASAAQTTLEAGTVIAGNNASADGGAIYNADAGTLLTLSGAVIGGSTDGTANTAVNGGGLYNARGAEVVIEASSSFQGNVATSVGGGLLNDPDSTMTIRDSSFSGNSAGYGGGLATGGQLTITGGEFASNTATFKGGGLFTAQNGTVTVSGAIIRENQSELGGGLTNGGLLTLSTVQFSSNAATANGGGVYNELGGDITIQEQSDFTGNSAAINGGAIYNKQGSSTIIIDNSVLGSAEAPNTAANGGGIYNELGGQITLQNGTALAGNNATANGGGIFNTDAESSLTLDSVLVGNQEAPNTAGDGGGGLYNELNAVVAIRGSSVFSFNTAEFGGALLNAGAGQITVEGESRFTNNTANNSGGAIYNWQSAELQITNSLISQNNAQFGGAISNASGGVFTLSTGEITANTAALNGGAIYNDGSRVTLLDNTSISENSTAGTAPNGLGGGIYNLNNAAFTMTGGLISTNTAANNGGGIYNELTSTITLNEGVQIINNTAANNGGGIFTQTRGSAITMNGGVISGNAANGAAPNGVGGGIYNRDEGSTVTLRAVIVGASGAGEGNTATFGGGIFNEFGADVLLQDASTISTNTAALNGGGVYNQGSGSTLSLDAGSAVTGNQAIGTAPDGLGGGIFNILNGTVTLTGATISNNQAQVNGGGIYNNGDGSRVEIAAGSTIVSNRAVSASGGGLYNTQNAALSVTDTTLTDNVGIGSALFNDSDAPVAVTESCFLNNADPDVVNESEAASVLAAGNWWGTYTDPSANIAGSVDVSNFLRAPGGSAPDCQGFIGGTVWLDANRSNTQEADERSLPSVRVQLFNQETGELVAEVVTDTSGYYGFIDPPVATAPYFVRFTVPPNLQINPDSLNVNEETAQTEPFAYTAQTILVNQNLSAINPPPGLTVGTTELNVTEGGEASIYTVYLNAPPNAPTVTVTVTADQDLLVNGAATATLTFTADGGEAPWNIPQQISVTAQDDQIAEGLESATITHSTLSDDTGYQIAARALPLITAAITDNDAASALLVETAPAELNEGASVTYRVRLATPPQGVVAIRANADNPRCQTLIEEALDSTNWETGVEVIVRVPENEQVDTANGCQITHTLSSDDPLYNLTDVIPVQLAILENDAAGVNITTQNMDVTEGGSSTFLITLDTQPLAPVTVTASTSIPQCAASVAGTLDAATWNSGIVATVTNVDDLITLDIIECTISYQLTSDDPAYNLAPEAVPTSTVLIADNDRAAVEITPNTLSAVEGGTAAFTITLTSQPTAPVQVVPVDSERCTLAAPVPLDSSNWNTGVTATITAVDNALVEGTTSCNVTFSTTSEDADYALSAELVPAVLVEIAENDSAGFALDAVEGLSVTEGATVEYVARLLTPPLAEVILLVQSSTAGCEAAASAPFTADNWQTGVTVTVQALEDDIAEAATTCTLRHSLTSEDPAYLIGESALPTVDVAVADNDATGVAIATTEISHTEGLSNTYRITLTSQPLAPVTLQPVSTSELCVASVTEPLTADNWQAGIAVTVSSADNFTVDGTRTCTIQHSVTSTDPAYNGVVGIFDVTVTVNDNDQVGVQTIPTELTLTEGSTANYVIALGSLPTAPVNVAAVSSLNRCNIAVADTINTENWQAGVPVTITVNEDTTVQETQTCIITHTLTSEDLVYNFAPETAPTTTVTVEDNDIASVSLSQNSQTVTEGETATYSLNLTSLPTAPVTIEATSEIAQCSVITTAITDANGNVTGADISITPADNITAEGTRDCIVRHIITSEDTNYNLDPFQSPFFTLTVLDNDRASALLGVDTLDVAEGASANYTLSLNSQPTAPVTVDLLASSPNCTAAAEGELNPDNWQDGITVTVTATENAIAEGARTCTIQHNLTSTDPIYTLAAETQPLITVNITDNDVAGLQLNGEVFEVTEGASAEFTLTLTSQPIGLVIVTAAADSPTCTAAIGSILDVTNWNKGIPITISAVDDQVANGTRTCTISYSLTSSDPGYTSAILPTTPVSVLDNETVGAVLSRTSFDVSEGDPVNYTVTLSSQPVAPVTLSAVASTPECVPTVFGALGADNWNTGITVTVLVNETEIFEGNRTCTVQHTLSSADANYNLEIETVTLNIQDDDEPPIVLQPRDTFDVVEGDQVAYTVTLNRLPSAPVIVEVATSLPECSALVSGALDATNWNTGVTVTVSTQANQIADGNRSCTITHALNSTDQNFNAGVFTDLNRNLPVATIVITDNDVVGINVSETALTLREGLSLTYTLTVTSLPIDIVEVQATASNERCLVTVDGAASLANWEAGIPITVSVAENDTEDGDFVCTISHDLVSNDPAYDALTVPAMDITVTEDDLSGVTLSGETFTLNEGENVSYTVNLNSQPTALVVLQATSSDNRCLVTVGEPVESQAWQQGVMVTVNVRANDIMNGETTCVISHNLLTNDRSYNELEVPPVTITVTEDDVAGVTVSSESLTATEGESVTYTLLLTSQPTNPVVLQATTSDERCLLSTGDAVSAGNWQQGITVTVSTLENSAVGTDFNCTISHDLISDDLVYNDLEVLPVDLAIAEDDRIGVAFNPVSLALNEGQSATYTISLTSQPEAVVNLEVLSSADACQLSSAGVLDRTNWDEGVSVTVSAANNAVTEPTRTCTLTHRLSSEDPNYTLEMVGDVSVTVADDDAAQAFFSASTLTLNEGESASYTITLSGSPATLVSVVPTSLNPFCALAVSGDLNSETWETGVTITVSTTENALAQGNTSCLIAHQLVSEDALFNLGSSRVATVTAEIIEDDSAGAVVEPLAFAIIEGETAAYTVNIASEPQQPVQLVTVASDGRCIVEGGGTLDAANWQTGLTVTIRTEETESAEGDLSCVVSQTLNSTDPNYNLILDPVTATITDDEIASLTLDAPETVTFAEGENITYTLTLGSAPTAPVTFTVLSSDPACQVLQSASELDSTTWNTPIEITISTFADEFAQGDRTCTVTHQLTSDDPNYNRATADLLTTIITVTDDEIASLTLDAPETVTFAEGEGITYTLTLGSAPTAPVTFAVLSSDPACQVLQSASELDSTTWNTPIVITISTLADEFAQGERTCNLTHQLTSADPNYNRATADLPTTIITVTDDDTASLTLDAPETVALAEGESITYTLVIGSAPTAPVSFEVFSSDPACQISQSAYEVDPLTWNTPIEITISTQANQLAQGDRTCSVTHQLSSDDPNYNRAVADLPTTSVSVTDDDIAGIAFNPETLTLAEGESGVYTLTLTSQPLVPVTISATASSDLCTVTIFGVLDVTNWQTGINGVVEAAQDTLVIGERLCDISHTLTSPDPTYNLSGDVLPAYSVTILDDDIAGAAVNDTAISVLEGSSSTYLVTLNSIPLAPVTVQASSAGECLVGADAPLTGDNWNTGVTVTVSIADNALLEGSRTCDISHTLVSDDPAYNISEGLSAVTATIEDNDLASLRLDPQIIEVGEGSSATYTIRLTSLPTAPVQVTALGSMEGCTVEVADELTAENWETGITVTVQAAEDQQILGARGCTITHSTTSEDANYNLDVTTTPTLTAALLDNDVAGVLINPTTLDGQEGDRLFYQIALLAQPEAPVTVLFASDNPECAVREAEPLTPENWNIGVSAVVIITENFLIEDSRTCTITHTLETEDPSYSTASSLPAVTITVNDNDNAAAVVSETVLNLAEGENASYLLSLTSQPGANVTVSATSENPTCIVAISDPLLTLDNWNNGVSITVNTVDNGIAQGEQTCRIRHSLSSEDENYTLSNSSLPDVEAIISDNDTAGVEVRATAVSQSEGLSNTYTVALTSQPTSPVTVTVISDNLDCTVSAAEALNADNWNAGVTITVSVVDDQIVNGERTCTISHTLSSEDANYDERAIAPVTVTINDNDPLLVSEGESNAYTLRLTSEPANPVTITASSDSPNCTIDAPITLDSNNWSDGALVTVNSVDDAIAQIGQTCLITHQADSEGALTNPESVTVAIADNDIAAAIFSTESLTLIEGDNEAYFVSLTSQPTAPVTLEATAVIPQCTLAVSEPLTAENWQTGVLVSVSAVDDSRVGGSTACLIAHRLISDDPLYNLSTELPVVTVTINDNDVAGVTLSAETLTVNEGETATYTLGLATEPTAPVEVSATTDNPACQVALSGSSVDASNWNTPLTLTISIADDLIDTPERSCTVTHTALSADSNYAEAALGSVVITLPDNDTAGVTFSTDTLSFNEGESANYIVTLTSQPTAPVTVNISSDNAACTVNLLGVLDAENWNSGIVAVVSTADDAGVSGQQTCTLSHTLASNDPVYDVLDDLATVAVTAFDNDTAGVAVSETTLTTSEGNSVQYTLTLTSQPLSPVTVTAETSSTSCTAEASNVLDASNWTSGVLVTVTSLEDQVYQAENTCTVSHSLSGDDPNYGLAATAPVSVSFTDNDQVGVLAQPGALEITEGESATYTLTLTSQPLAPVTVNAQADSPECTVAVSETLTPENWNSGVVVTVSTTDNQIVDITRLPCTILHSLASEDSSYNLNSVAGVTVSLVNNDSAGLVISDDFIELVEGDSATYTLTLTSQPIADVSIEILSDVPDCVTSLSGILDASNWNSGITVTVGGNENSRIEAGRICTLNHRTLSADPNYEFLSGVVLVPVADDDTAGVTFSTATLEVIEGAAGVYTITLSSEPAAPVTVTANSTSPECAVIGFGTLDSTNWQMGITTTVNIAENAIAEGSRVCTIRHTTTSDDPNYALPEAELPQIDITVQDNDTADAQISATDMQLTEGESSTYTLSLSSQPLAPVTITLSTPLFGCAAVASDALTPENWQAGVTITVTAEDNAFVAENPICSVQHSLTSTDPNYTRSAENMPVLSVSVLDNDSVGVVAAPDTLSLLEGGSATYTLTLTSQPLEPVTVEAAASLTECAASVAEPLTTANWNTGVIVTVTSADNAEVDAARTCTIEHSLSSADNSYTLAASTVPTVAVAIENDDLPQLTYDNTAISVNEGESGSYTLTLTHEPPAPVTVAITPSNPECLATISGVLDETTWNTGVIITLSVADNLLVEGERTCTLEHTVISSDPDYRVGGIQPVTATIIDNDIPGISVLASSVTHTEGLSNTYTLALDSQPVGPVIITASSDLARCTTAVSSVLDRTNWETGITITVSSVDNQIADDASTCTITHAIISSDPNYSTLDPATIPTVAVTVLDNDGASAVVTPTELTLTEGESASYTLTLTSQPVAEVNVDVLPGEGCSVSTPDPLDATNWNVGIRLTVSVTDDAAINGTRTCTIQHNLSSEDQNYTIAADALPVVTTTINDNDFAAVLVEPQALTLGEGEDATYTLRLTSAPAEAVTVAVAGSDPACTATAAALIDSTNWQSGVLMTVTISDDRIVNGTRFCTLQHSLSSTDTNYSLAVDATPQVEVTITDNDVAEVMIEPVAGEVVEGESLTYTMRLGTEPRGAVTIEPTVLTQGCQVAAAGELNNTNWDAGVTLTVTAEDNALLEGTRTCVVLHVLSSQDPAYALTAQSTPTFTATILDNDVATAAVNGETFPLAEGESGTYFLTLTAAPTAPVTVEVRPSSEGCTAVAGGVLDSTNWNTGVGINVTIVENNVVEGETACELAHTLTSDDPNYTLGTEDLPIVTISISDNDTAGVVIDPLSLSTTEGESITYTIRLNSQPLAPVTVVTDDDNTACRVLAADQLTAENWQTGVTITVTTADDNQIDAAQTCTITHQLESEDLTYRLTEGLSNVTVFVAEDDTAAIEVDPTSLTLIEGEAQTYTLRLTSQPEDEVVVLFSTAADQCLATTDESLTAENWNTGITVRVEALDNSRVGNSACAIQHTLSSADENFNVTSANLAVIPVQIEDTDVPGLALSAETLEVIEGETGTYLVLLTTEPAAPVTVNVVSSSRKCNVTASVTLDASTWNSGAAISVQTGDNAVIEPNPPCTLQHSLVTDDPNYAALTVLPELQVSVAENDVPGVIITPLELTIAEGGSASYTVTLATAPSANATLNLIPNRRECQVSASGALNSTNWNTGITVTVSVADNTTADGTRSCVIQNYSLGSRDPNYVIRPGNMPDVEVTITDNE